jgi:hypothetical protein
MVFSRVYAGRPVVLAEVAPHQPVEVVGVGRDRHQVLAEQVLREVMNARRGELRM